MKRNAAEAIDDEKKKARKLPEKCKRVKKVVKVIAEECVVQIEEKVYDLVNRNVSIKEIVDKVKGHLHSKGRGKVPTGQDFRQLLDNSNPHVHTEILGKYEMGKRVGRIQLTGGPGVGTGFRVGSKYVMTAYHVMKENLKRLWEIVNRFLTDEEKEEIGWTTDKVPVTSWNISSLISSDPKSKDKIMELVNLVTEDYEIKFEFLNEKDEGRTVKFKPDIVFASPEYDVLVLELAKQDSELKVLGLVEDNGRDEKLHVFGHPSGKPLQHDPACTILKEETELSELRKEGIDFFKKECNKKEWEIEQSYSPCVITEDKILFHSSSSTAHGASGAPLTIISKGIPKVYGMLLCGHPGVFYNSFKGPMKRLDLLVESGISMKKVRSLLKSFLPDLEKDLFRNF